MPEWKAPEPPAIADGARVLVVGLGVGKVVGQGHGRYAVDLVGSDYVVPVIPGALFDITPLAAVPLHAFSIRGGHA